MIIAATNIMIMKECLRYFESISDVINPSFAKIKAMYGDVPSNPRYKDVVMCVMNWLDKSFHLKSLYVSLSAMKKHFQWHNTSCY